MWNLDVYGFNCLLYFLYDCCVMVVKYFLECLVWLFELMVLFCFDDYLVYYDGVVCMLVIVCLIVFNSWFNWNGLKSVVLVGSLVCCVLMIECFGL